MTHKSYKILLISLLATFSCKAGVHTYNASEAHSQSGPIVIKFYQKPCGPCESLAPVYNKLSGEYPNVKFYQADAGSNPQIKDLKFKLLNKRVGNPVLVFFASGSDLQANKMTGDPIVGYGDGVENIIRSRINRIAGRSSAPMRAPAAPVMKAPARAQDMGDARPVRRPVMEPKRQAQPQPQARPVKKGRRSCASCY